MTALCLVLAAHLFGDWIVQTDHQAASKTTSWRSMHAHCLTYHAVMAAAIVPVWTDWRAAVLLAVSYSSHAIIDRRWPVRRLLAATGSPHFAEQQWGILVADQVLHLSILLVLVGLLG